MIPYSPRIVKSRALFPTNPSDFRNPKSLKKARPRTITNNYGAMRVPVSPASASPMFSGLVMMASWPPFSRNQMMA